MANYLDMTHEQRQQELDEVNKRYQTLQSQGLQLNMARGKPAPEQLSLSDGLLDIGSQALAAGEFQPDPKNYGGLRGLDKAIDFFADFMGVSSEQVIVAGNSSLQLMYLTVARGMLFGFGGQPAWSKQPKVKFLCPVPGYDRHFGICESFGIEMITVPMDENGPDMSVVESIVADDESVKGIWCVPQYSNPTGSTYGSDVVDRLFQMRPKAADFRIFWDNAYAHHHLHDEEEVVQNGLKTAEKFDCPDRVFMFGSTSKITHAGAGVSVFAASEANVKETVDMLQYGTIGFDKINMARHVLFLKDMEHLRRHMQQHAAIMRPKFDSVASILNKELADTGIASWTVPKGGYFLSLDVYAGTAKETVALAKELGVVLTGAGATYPLGQDPSDQNIRIAPSFPSVPQVEQAAEALAVCAKLSALKVLTQ